MDRTHHGEPFISRTLRRDALTHFIIKNLRAAAGQTVKSGLLQTTHDRFVVQLRNEMKVVNLRRREAVQLKAGIFRAQVAQEIFVPLEAEVRMQSALHQHAGAAERDGLIDLFADLVEGAHVGVGRARPSIKGAKRTDYRSEERSVG